MSRKRVDIYHHSSKESREEASKPCAWCGSSGTVKAVITGTKMTYDVCKGTGHNAFSETAKPCARCQGTGSVGKTLVGARIKCDVCKGKGYNQIG